MYTQCPECTEAFRVTAANLKQASGKVRCGSCGVAFNALLYLSETRPDPAAGEKFWEGSSDLAAGQSADPEATPESVFAERSEALLKALDDLAGSNVRLKDTGVEWQLLADDGEEIDDDAPDIFSSTDTPIDAELSADSGTAIVDELLDDSPGPIDEFLTETPNRVDAAEVFAGDAGGGAAEAAEDVRYDDDTGVPETAGDYAVSAQTDTQTDRDQSPADDTDRQADLAFGDSEDWEELLDEMAVDDAPPEGASGDSAQESLPAFAGDEPADSGVDEELPELVAEDHAEDEGAARGDFDDGASVTVVLHKEPLRAGGSFELTEENPGIETIIMEGDTVRTLREQEAHEAGAGTNRPAAESDFLSIAKRTLSGTLIPVRRPRSSAARGTGFGIVVLALLLAGQAVHQSRAELAAVPALNRYIVPVYRTIGKPVTPDWDVRGWRFENATGSVVSAGAGGSDSGSAEEVLAIFSRVGNRTSKALAYPLISVSLTDRFEEVIGNTVVAPSDYLAGNEDIERLVPGNDAFNAAIAIRSPPDDATGFQLNVCYRLADGKLRCATEAFR